MPRKPALVCLVRTCSYKELPRRPSPTFKFQVLSCAPSMKAAFQSNLRVFCNFFFMYLGFGLLTCEYIYIIFFCGFLPNTLVTGQFPICSGWHQQASACCILLCFALWWSLRSQDRQGEPVFLSWWQKKHILIVTRTAIAADGLTDSPPEVSAHFKPLLLCQFLVRICDKSLNIL